MEPAKSIISKFGGHDKVAEIAGVAYTAPYRWCHRVEKGGTGGLIPQKHHPKLLAHARANGIDLRAEDFLPVSEVAA